MLEFHGTCTIIALKKEKQYVFLKLLMGGVSECAQDNHPMGPYSLISAIIDRLQAADTALIVGDQVRISGIQKGAEIELTSIKHEQCVNLHE